MTKTRPKKNVPVEHPTIRCERCGKSIKKTRDWTRWCSTKCRREAWQEQNPRRSDNLVEGLRFQIRDLRRLLFITHQCPASPALGQRQVAEDGELACPCGVDFRRDSLSQLTKSLTVEDSGGAT